jgi:hypothetical protein
VDAEKARRRLRLLRRRRRSVLLLLLIVFAVAAADLVHFGGRAPSRPSAPHRSGAGPSAASSPWPSAGTTLAPSAGTGAGPSAAAEPEAPGRSGISVPNSGTGRLTLVAGSTPVRGSGGTLVRYRVEVEDGSGQSPAAFAAAVDATLRDPRGWTHDHQWRFQRVATGTYDATVILATPALTNQICAEGGLNPGGYTSCRTNNKVVINLARWLTAVPAFRGDIATYRQYVVDHEMGHQLGHGHVLCNGPGQPAPVMQQQTLGLQGCRPNPWPFVGGRYLTGAPTAGQ